jgi:hypothetical protein
MIFIPGHFHPHLIAFRKAGAPRHLKPLLSDRQQFNDAFCISVDTRTGVWATHS